MLIYALDDEPLLLDALKNSIAEAEPTAIIHTFSRAKPALKEIDNNNLCPDVAFIDIEMPRMSGLEFAKTLKDRTPKTNFVFVTGFRQYAVEAAQLYMSGYVMKPVDADIWVQCFGNFEVFAGRTPLTFRYSKTKELFAYLIDRKGAAISS